LTESTFTERLPTILNSSKGTDSDARYAVYFAPPPGSDWWALGSKWLGRDALTGRALDQPLLPGMAPARLAAMTADARLYGFHATLKPPMYLAAGVSGTEFFDAAVALAGQCKPFDLGWLAARTLGGFVALLPEQPIAELTELAGQCVAQLDGLRTPVDPADLARRRAKGLTPRQDELLQRWGYPYVMEEWRFHMTLTNVLSADDAALVLQSLAPRVERLNAAPLQVDALSIFVQPARTEPFRMVMRCGFDGSVSLYR